MVTRKRSQRFRKAQRRERGALARARVPQVRRALAAFAVALAAAGAALAADPAVPLGEQRQLGALLTQIGAPDLAFVPTRLPPHFAFASFSVTGTPRGLDVSFADQRYAGNPTKARVHEISFDTAFFERTIATCSRRARRTLHVSGGAVFSDGSRVWRCVRARDGRVIVASAHGLMPVGALAGLVASARPVSLP